jgi:hypothetical protein
MMDKNTADILRAAAARVRQGWTQMVMVNANKVCALGAIGTVGGATGWYLFASCVFQQHSDTIIHLQRALALPTVADSGYEWARYTNAIGAWNDAEGQTAENVAAGLEYAALIWEQEQAVNAVAAPVEEPQSPQFAQKDQP